MDRPNRRLNWMIFQRDLESLPGWRSRISARVGSDNLQDCPSPEGGRGLLSCSSGLGFRPVLYHGFYSTQARAGGARIFGSR